MDGRVYWSGTVVAGLNSNATRTVRGAISFNSPTHFPPSVPAGSLDMKPVMLPPGCARFAAKPLPIGSDTPANTIGIVFVSRARAPVTGVVTPKIALGRRSTSCYAAEQRYEVAPFHCPVPPVLSTESIAHLGTADCCIYPPGRNEMIAITPPIIFSKEVAQNRPPHFCARTSSPPEIVSDQISGEEAWMNFRFSRALPPGGPRTRPP